MDIKKLKCMGLKHSEKYFEKDYVTIFLRLMNCSQWKKMLNPISEHQSLFNSI